MITDATNPRAVWGLLTPAQRLAVRALLHPPETPQAGELIGVVRLCVYREGAEVCWVTDGEQLDGEAEAVARALREAGGGETSTTQGAAVPREK